MAPLMRLRLLYHLSGEGAPPQGVCVYPGVIAVSVLSVSVPRPVIHPLSSPSNMFCVTSLDPDTLPSVATLLMDVMFYSGG